MEQLGCRGCNFGCRRRCPKNRCEILPSVGGPADRYGSLALTCSCSVVVSARGHPAAYNHDLVKVSVKIARALGVRLQVSFGDETALIYPWQIVIEAR
jgi:hypothetical protein